MSTRDRVLNQNKVAKLTDIGKLIKDGDSVAVGGAWLSSHPMALVRQIIRSGIKNLHVMTILGSVDIDMLVGAGCVDRLMFSFVSMEAYGLPPNFRRAVEKGNLKCDEISGLAIIIGFEATGRGVPFLPYRGPSGSDFLKQRPDFYKQIACPFTGEEMMAIPAIKPDVAIIHAQRADAAGSIQIEGTAGSDLELAKAAKKVIVTVEEIVPTDGAEGESLQDQDPQVLCRHGYRAALRGSPDIAGSELCRRSLAHDEVHGDGGERGHVQELPGSVRDEIGRRIP